MKVREILSLPRKEESDIDSNVDIDFPVKQQKLKRREVINLLFHVKVSLNENINKCSFTF